MKRLFYILLSLVFMLSITTFAVFAEENIKIMINNQTLNTNDPPVIIDGRTLVPLRAIGEAMGCEVIWVAGTETANLKNDTTIVSMQISNKWVTRVKRVTPDNPTRIEIDVPPMLINDKTYIPARAFAESLGAVVGWDGGTNTVMIVYDTTLNYVSNKEVTTFAGDGERKNYDSNTLLNMSFVSPESIDVASDGTIYVTDSGQIRKIKDGKSETVEIEPKYITAESVRCYKNDAYVLTNAFQDEKGVKFYGIVKLSGNNAEGVFITEAIYSRISDFTISSDGDIYVLQNNVGVGKNYIGKINLATQAIDIVTEVDSGIKSIAADQKGNLYLSNTVKGSLYRYNFNEAKVRLFAGVDNKMKFVDGVNPFFFEPRKIKYYNDSLYVLDYNVLRKVNINSGDVMINAETIVGKVSVEPNPDTLNGKASEVIFAPSYLMDFIPTSTGIIISDPKKAVLRIIK